MNNKYKIEDDLIDDLMDLILVSINKLEALTNSLNSITDKEAYDEILRKLHTKLNGVKIDAMFIDGRSGKLKSNSIINLIKVIKDIQLQSSPGLQRELDIRAKAINDSIKKVN